MLMYSDVVNVIVAPTNVTTLDDVRCDLKRKTDKIMRGGVGIGGRVADEENEREKQTK